MSEPVRELLNSIAEARRAIDAINAMMDHIEAAAARLLPSGDSEKMRETERTERQHEHNQKRST